MQMTIDICTRQLMLRSAAGSDTTAATLLSLIRCVGADDTIRYQLAEDVRNSTSFHSSKYLDACYKEALRLHPAVPLDLPRDVPCGGIKIDGIYFPDDTQVGVSPLVYNRMSNGFGSHPERFRPERWLEREDRDKLLTFGHGTRMCPGKNVSLSSRITTDHLVTLTPRCRSPNMRSKCLSLN